MKSKRAQIARRGERTRLRKQELRSLVWQVKQLVRWAKDAGIFK